jgi:superkiller protein 3
LAHRIAATFYLLDGDYLSVSDVATSALSLLRRIESDAAVSLGNSRRDIETQLASALTRLHPPQHHVRALRLVSSVLGAAPDNIDALLSKGLIDEAAGRWEEARAAFVHVQQLALAQAAASPLSPSRAPALEAQGEVAWCDVCAGRLEEGRVALEAVIDRLDDAASAAVVDGAARARAWWRLGRCLWQIGGEARSDPDQAFTCFITALKRSAGFAPAFTALGFFYDEVAKDAARASKCFQKAFELDAREDEAARRLAEGFAEEREWDLVDVVARRTVEGEGGAEALGGAAGNVSQKRHMSRNAWAWRAIGSVELHRERHEEAIAAFQVALRAEPHDAGTWQRLGEAYAASQRQAAALKTFAKALQLSHGAWQVRYSIAEVHRELGDVDEAQELLEHILKEQPEEIGVRVAAAETSLQLAQREVQTGYVLRAEASLETTLQHVLQAVRLEPHLRSAWKVAADALFELSRFGRLVQGRTMREGVVEQLVQLAAQDDVDAQLGDVSSAVTLKYVAQCRESEHAYLSAAAFLYKACVVLHGSDEDATAWADLAVALHQLDLVAKLKDAATQGTQCIQRALKLEPGNEALWMILGSLAFKTNVKLAQHCFVRAIEASPRVSCRAPPPPAAPLLAADTCRRTPCPGAISASSTCSTTTPSWQTRPSSAPRRWTPILRRRGWGRRSWRSTTTTSRRRACCSSMPSACRRARQ